MYVPMPPPPPPSPEARELAEFIEKVIDAYRINHPEMSLREIRQAVKLAEPSAGNPLGKQAVGAMILGLVMFFGVGLYYSKSVSGTGIGGEANIPWVIIGIAVMAAVVGLVAVIKR